MAHVSTDMLRHRFSSEDKTSLSKVKKLEGNLKTTVAFDRPIVGFAKAIDPVDNRIDIDPFAKFTAFHVQMEDVEPGLLPISNQRLHINRSHANSTRSLALPNSMKPPRTSPSRAKNSPVI
jgi:hypothetical protein